MHFDDSQPNQLDFSGTPPIVGGTEVSLSAQDPLNTTATTQFQILAEFGNASSSSSAAIDEAAAGYPQVAGSVAAGLLGLTALIGAGFGFWRYTTDKTSRSREQLGDFIRTALNLKGVNNFNHEIGQKYLTFVHGLQKGLQGAGINLSNMRPGELRELANDVAAVARNKITPATDCLGQSVITVTDLNDNLEVLVTEVQVLRSSGQQRGYVL